MRQPATSSALLTVVAALPTESLRPLLLQILLNGSGTDTPEPEPPARTPQRCGGGAWRCDRGVRRGPRKVAIAKAHTEAADPKAAARWRRANERRRAKRAAERQAKASTGMDLAGNPARSPVNKPLSRSGKPSNGKPGNGSAPAESTPSASALWRRARTLQPRTPWKAVARGLGINEAQALDAHRNGSLPPGVAASAIERFLALPTT
jgi:hypothetical protein